METRGRRIALVGVALALMCVHGLTTGEAQEGIMIVENGQPKATIVVPAAALGGHEAREPMGKVALAAEELQIYIENVSGARLAIVSEEDNPEGTLILVGKQAYGCDGRGDSFRDY